MGVGSTIGAVAGTVIAPGIGTIIGSGLGSLAEGGYDWWLANQQKDKVNQLEQNNVRPEAVTPQADIDALNNAKGLASMTRLPGQNAIEGKLDEITANKVALAERNGIGGPTSINAASRAYGDQMDKENELGVAAATNYNKNQAALRDEEHNIGNNERSNWDWNYGQPYTAKQKAIAALKGSSLNNQTQAFSNISGGLTMGLSSASDAFNWFGDGAKTTPTVKNDGYGNWYNPTPDNTGAPNYGKDINNPDSDYSNLTEKLINGGMGFFTGE